MRIVGIHLPTDHAPQACNPVKQANLTLLVKRMQHVIMRPSIIIVNYEHYYY